MNIQHAADRPGDMSFASLIRLTPSERGPSPPPVGSALTKDLLTRLI